MKSFRIVLLISICLLFWQGTVLAQDTVDQAAPKHPIALKIQAYSPLSLLVQPFVGRSATPFTPRFWTGELEVGLSVRSSVQVLVGGMQHQESAWGWFSPDNSAYRIAAAYRYYLATKAYGFRAGPYLSTGLAFARGERHLPSEILPNYTTKRALSSSLRVGWQQRIKNHLLIDLGVGAEIGFVRTSILGQDASAGLRISAFDYPLAKLSATPDAKGRVWGIAGSPSLALGWLF